MKCSRCDGAMSYEVFYSHEGAFRGWRCILCGEILDETVLKNRQSSKQNKHERKG